MDTHPLQAALDAGDAGDAEALHPCWLPTPPSSTLPCCTTAAPEDRVQSLAGEAELSEREREVVRLISEGRTTREIGEALNLSENTIHTHRQHIMHKLDKHSIAELTKYAIRTGLTSL